jgi:superkiller protein 3
LSDLPHFNEDVLLDIDVDYFDPPDLGKRLSVPSLWPEELITILMKKGVKTNCVTVCYSVKGGYLALEYKFLGDDLASILKDPKGSNSVLTQIREHRKSGHVYRSRGMYSEAGKEFQKGLELSPNDAALHYGLGLVYDQWGKVGEASVEFDSAKAIDERYENPALYDADYYFQKGMFDRALPLYQKVLQKDPANLGSSLAAGVCSSKQGATEKAVEYYQSFIERSPDFYLVHFDLGVVYSQLERWEKAEMEYRRAVELNPSFGKAYQNLGLLYLNRGEMDRAIGAFGKALENNPCFKGAHNNLGSLYANAGKYEEAIAAFKKAVRIDPRYAPGYRNLGKTYLLQGKVDDASKAFQQALAINPKDESILQLLDRIHKK